MTNELDDLAGGPIDDADARALEQLAQLYGRLDPVPGGLVERIRFGITLDALEAEVAQLQRGDDLVGVRGDTSDADAARTITFTTDSVTTMITVTLLPSQRARIDGWVAPGGGVLVELRTVDHTYRTDADADGRFVFTDIPRGFVQFLVRPPQGSSQPPVITPSIEI